MMWISVNKSSSIWVSKIDSVKNISTLEGLIVANKGDYLCKGIEGELWAMKKVDLNNHYSPTGNIDGCWQEYSPSSEKVQLWARELKVESEVVTQFGKLRGAKGDFVIKEKIVGKEEESCWIVKKAIFYKTYILKNQK